MSDPDSTLGWVGKKWGIYDFSHYINGFPHEIQARKASKTSTPVVPEEPVQEKMDFSPRELTELSPPQTLIDSRSVPVKSPVAGPSAPPKRTASLPTTPSDATKATPPDSSHGDSVDFSPRGFMENSSHETSGRRWELCSVNGRWHLVGHETARSRPLIVGGVERVATPLQVTEYGRLVPLTGTNITEGVLKRVHDALWRLRDQETGLRPGDVVLDHRGRIVFTVTDTGIHRQSRV